MIGTATPVRSETSRGNAEALPAFSDAVWFHHSGTAKHSTRVGDNAAAISESLGLDVGEIEVIHWAGILHDLGKICISAAILNKPGRLTADEYDTVKRHSTVGADLLTSISPSLAPIADIVRHHHERWDGSGYPHGLQGLEIPFGARIIGVVDVFDAIAEGRDYHVAGPSVRTGPRRAA